MADYTPMMQQYLQIKEEQQDAILFFRLGDFYEMFFEDAKIASRELEIVLTARDGGAGSKIPMCGVPYHSVDNYLARLINRGYKVAICEQVEDPREAKGLVKREITRIVTPGTIIEEQLLDQAKNNFLAAVEEEPACTGIAYIDISTGEFWLCEIAGENARSRVESEILRISPAECLLAGSGSLTDSWEEEWLLQQNITLTVWDEPPLSLERAENLLLRQLQVASLESFGLKSYSAGIKAAARIIAFLEETQKTSLQHIKSLRCYSSDNYLEMDFYSRRNLELTATLREGKREGSLLSILDESRTAMGKRLLRRWIEQPLREAGEIEERLDAVDELKNTLSLRTELNPLLSRINDLERLGGKIGASVASPRDLLGLKSSLAVINDIKKALQPCRSEILQRLAAMDALEEVFALIDASINDEAPLGIKEGELIKTGYKQEIDELRELSQEGTNWLVEFENREKQRTGIKNLKVGFNKVFGYYIEITKSNLSLAPADYHRKQTLVNSERYISDELKQYEEKILGSRERLYSLEYQEFIKIREALIPYLPQVMETAHAIAILDVLQGLAEVAYQNNYIRPEIDNSGKIRIRAGRHPVVEKALREARFVPNDLQLDRDKARFAIITGPNMGGKSTFMRQAALLVLMAQMGSFIPAEEAQIGLVDKIFTRVGASDDLAAGQSTFMVEMIEVANILNNASDNSLVILDEIGRGTSTYDGLSIAQAVSEYLLEHSRSKVLFATHYHELTSLAEKLPGIVNLSVSVKETGNTVVFLKKVLPGKADKSYGLHVARLAGLPEKLIMRAEDILQGLEKGKDSRPAPSLLQPLLFSDSHPVVDELKQLDIDDLSPREAWKLLYQWQKMLDDK
ncbi:MAG: DNA mismatch repair protein MutS [Syntrophomonas sp.]|nr:DNA mismatch repair protein MutS [Syntrophomonas sp.]